VNAKGGAVETLLRVGLSNAVAAGLLALAAASVGVFARGRPALRHGLWILVLLKLVTPPLWTVPVAWVGGLLETATQGPETLARLPDGGQAPLFSAPEPNILLEDDPEIKDAAPAMPAPVLGRAPAFAEQPWSGWVFLLWGTGSLLTFGVASWRIRQFQRILKLAEPGPESLRSQVEALARRLGLAQVPTIGLVPGVVSPLVWWLGRRACLIVPQGLWDRLDERQRDTLMTHELAHLRRGDHWVRCLELLVTGLYWWLPVVWIARYAVREAEEQCCDAWVVWAFPDATRTYAEALLETLDFLSGAGPAAAVAASGLGPVHHLKRRMTMIMQGTTPRALTWSGLLAVLSFSAMLLPLSPSWAQRADDKETPAVAPEEPVARDPDPQPEPQRDRPDAPKPRREVRTFRYNGEELKERSEALERALIELREVASRKEGGVHDERARAELERTIDRLQALVRREPPEVESREGVKRAPGGRPQPSPRRPDAGKRPQPDAAKDSPEAKERRAEVAKLREEVAERQKALMEAQMRLSKAMRQMAGAGMFPEPPGRNERFEFRFPRPGQGPPEPEKMFRMIPRPDQDRRIAELEERLEKLQDEVKSLKKDAPERK